MKKLYNGPTIEISQFMTENIITSSGELPATKTAEEMATEALNKVNVTIIETVTLAAVSPDILKLKTELAGSSQRF